MQLKTSSLLVAVILAACLMALGAVSPALAATPSQADDAGAMQVSYRNSISCIRAINLSAAT